MTLSLSLPEREIGVKMTFGPVGDAPKSIPTFESNLKMIIKPLLPLMLWTYSKFPEIPRNNSGSERLKSILRVVR